MDVNIGEVQSTLTLTDADEVGDAAHAQRIARIAARLVLEELRREEQRQRTRLDRRRIDVERY